MQLFSFSPLRPFVSLPYERRATTSMGTLGRAIYSVGFWIRETGQALDRLGCRLQGNYYFQEQCKTTSFPLIPFHFDHASASCANVWGGNPAKFLRKLTDEEIAFISQSATNYANLAQVHAAENAKSFDEIEFEKVLRKKFAHRDEEYDSMLGVVREVPPELILPGNILPDKSPKPSHIG
ncbi:hypothetical protein GW17_00005934 [Ensete ventricosum]|nr:hypothetical protein GW17_00005934 [Ensete ventricosum]RZS00428.1 hypothetical protein BHM03_00030125 [Ensete ventricosum]